MSTTYANCNYTESTNYSVTLSFAPGILRKPPPFVQLFHLFYSIFNANVSYTGGNPFESYWYSGIVLSQGVSSRICRIRAGVFSIQLRKTFAYTIDKCYSPSVNGLYIFKERKTNNGIYIFYAIFFKHNFHRINKLFKSVNLFPILFEFSIYFKHTQNNGLFKSHII